eukprot:365718-Chlamydomonas_euryale.AAC.5
MDGRIGCCGFSAWAGGLDERRACGQESWIRRLASMPLRPLHVAFRVFMSAQRRRSTPASPMYC